MALLTISLLALLCACWLLFAWMRQVAADVPEASIDWRDPAPRYWRLLGWPGHALGCWLSPWLPAGARRRIDAQLQAAGLAYALRPEQLLGGQAAGALIATAVLVLAARPAGLPPAWLLAAAMTTGWLLPRVWVADRAKKRQRQIGRTLPFYLDVLTLAIEAGSNVTGALHHAVEKGPGGPLADEIERVLRDVRAGRTRAEALRSMAERLAMPSISNWVGAVIAAEKQGSSLGPILRTQAEQRRVDRFLRAEAMALKAPVKMLFPLVSCIFPCTFIIVFFPIAVKIVFEGLLG
ncbi:MAG: type II secretion system F family protein [Lautropia sp.]